MFFKNNKDFMLHPLKTSDSTSSENAVPHTHMYRFCEQELRQAIAGHSGKLKNILKLKIDFSYSMS